MMMWTDFTSLIPAYVRGLYCLKRMYAHAPFPRLLFNKPSLPTRTKDIGTYLLSIHAPLLPIANLKWAHVLLVVVGLLKLS
jgi:hypothetical protein